MTKRDPIKEFIKKIKTRPCDICGKGLQTIMKDGKAECMTCQKKKYGIGN